MIEEVLQHYHFVEPEFSYIRHNENITYKIQDRTISYLVRIHREAEGLNFQFLNGKIPRRVYVKSEIELLSKINSETNLRVQQPLKNKQGKYITELQSGDLATVLSWIEGEDLIDFPMTQEIAFEIGRTIGRLHQQMSKWHILNRYSYDGRLMEMVYAEIEEAHQKGHLFERHYHKIGSFLSVFTKLLQKEKSNFILIHGDLNKSNLILHNREIVPIDFSLSGYGLAERDLADMRWSLNDPSLEPFLIEGYASIFNGCPRIGYMNTYAASSLIQYIAFHHGKLYRNENFEESLDQWMDSTIDPAYEQALLLLQ